MTALAIVTVALHVAMAAITYLWVVARIKDLRRDVIHSIDEALDTAPVIAPDPRVDDLMRVVSTLKGAEALRQTYGKTN